MKKFSFIIFIFLFISIPAFAVEYTGATHSGDAKISEDNPTTNYETETTFALNTDQGGTNRLRTLTKFDVSGFPANAGCISSATLYMYYTGYFGSNDPVGRQTDVWKCTRAYTNAGATWNTYDGSNSWTAGGGDYVTTSPVGNNSNIPASASWQSWDVTEIVKDAIDNESGIANILMKFNNEIGIYYIPLYCSKENVGNHPYLTITYDKFVLDDDPASVQNRRIISYDENEEGALTLSGYYFGTVPTHIEARIYTFGSYSDTTQINSADWTQLTNETIADGAWTGILSEIPKTNYWLDFETRKSNYTAHTDTLGNRIGVGYVFGFIGQSYIWAWVTPTVIYTPDELETSDDLCSKFIHAEPATYSQRGYTGWALNTGDGSIYFANKLQSEFDCPIGILDYGQDAAAILEANKSGTYGYWLGGADADENWYDFLLAGLAISEPMNRIKMNAMIWYQGFSDALKDVAYQDYYDGMTDLNLLLRADSNNSTIPMFIVGQPNCEWLSGQHDEGFSLVRCAQKHFCINNKELNRIFAGQAIDQPLEDTIHLTEDGTESEAIRYAQSVLWHLIGTGDYTYHRGPKCTGFSVVDTTHTDITIEHDGGTDFTPTSGIDSFEVYTGSWIAATGARQDATTVRLTHAAGTVTDFRCLYGTEATVTNILVDNSALALPIEAVYSWTYEQDLEEAGLPAMLIMMPN